MATTYSATRMHADLTRMHADLTRMHADLTRMHADLKQDVNTLRTLPDGTLPRITILKEPV